LGVSHPQSENFVGHSCADGPSKIAREATHRQTHGLCHIDHLNGTMEITKNKMLGPTYEHQIPGPSTSALTGQHPTHWHINRLSFGSMPLHAPIELSDRRKNLAREIHIQA
jgi:Uri superfamily endonuclease